MSLDELLGLALTLYVLASLVLGSLRRGSRGRAPGDVPPRRHRDWEEELRDLLEGRGPREPEPWEEFPAPGDDEPQDDRPWLEVEPIPPPTATAPVPVGHQRQGGAEEDEGRPERLPPVWKEIEQGVEEPGDGLQEQAEVPVAAPEGRLAQTAAPISPSMSVSVSRHVTVRDDARSLVSAKVGGLTLPFTLPGDPEQWRQAVIMREVLDAPRALRPYRLPHLEAARR